MSLYFCHFCHCGCYILFVFLFTINGPAVISHSSFQPLACTCHQPILWEKNSYQLTLLLASLWKFSPSSSYCFHSLLILSRVFPCNAVSFCNCYGQKYWLITSHWKQKSAFLQYNPSISFGMCLWQEKGVFEYIIIKVIITKYFCLKLKLGNLLNA